MPPSRHSSSSHHSSSRSHSSSHRSHSSSSHRSSSSSYRSHSSSSHGSSYGKNSYSRGGSAATYSSKNTRPDRPRFHQPTSYSHASTHPTTSYNCKKHDYVFYPMGWTDSISGQTYEKGYYDENGNRYETLILKHNEKYENVPMHCEYCGTTLVRDLTDDNQNMECPNCSANMVIDAILDEEDNLYAESMSSPYYTKPLSVSPRMKATLITVIILVVMSSIMPCITTIFGGMLSILGMLTPSNNNNNVNTVNTNNSAYTQTSTAQSLSNTDIYGKTLYLDYVEDGCFELTDSSTAYERMLNWNSTYESYYDPYSDCYLWYNTDVKPNTWQYWYEGISSDYGDYGWMEYEDGIWYIEVDNGVWEELSPSYDMSEVYHLAE